MKKIVWVLGAGASRGAMAFASGKKGKKILIPTQKDFWTTFLSFASKQNKDRDIIETFLFRFFTKYDKKPARIEQIERIKMLNEIDVEEVFTFLSERIISDTISANNKKYFNSVYEIMSKTITNTFKKFKKDKTTNLIYRKFKENLIRKKDSFISFNYDLILEKALKESVYCYGLSNVKENKNANPLFKPHGSINWISNGNNLKMIKSDSRIKLGFVVPPTHLKFINTKNLKDSLVNDYLNNESLRKIWSAMETKLKEANCITFIGYSFPAADLSFSSIFRSVLAQSNKKKIIIVNPDALRISEKITERFSISSREIDIYYDFQSFVSTQRNSLLKNRNK